MQHAVEVQGYVRETLVGFLNTLKTSNPIDWCIFLIKNTVDSIAAIQSPINKPGAWRKNAVVLIRTIGRMVLI